MRPKPSASLCVLATLIAPSAARAIDTVEPFGAGVSDVELYVGGEGLGRRGEAALVSSFQLGYGVTERVSAYVNGSASGALRAGAYATALDTTHVDLDLFLDYGTTGDATGAASGVELNLDLGGLGLFATAWAELHDPLELEIVVGLVATVAEGHQLLLGCDPRARAVAAGYNVTLHDGVELINEVGVELPPDGGDAAFSLSTGVLLTLR